MYGQALIDQTTDEISGLKARLAGWDAPGFPEDDLSPRTEIEEGYFGTEEFLGIAREIMEWRAGPEAAQPDAKPAPARRGRPRS